MVPNTALQFQPPSCTPAFAWLRYAHSSLTTGEEAGGEGGPGGSEGSGGCGADGGGAERARGGGRSGVSRVRGSTNSSSSTASSLSDDIACAMLPRGRRLHPVSVRGGSGTLQCSRGPRQFPGDGYCICPCSDIRFFMATRRDGRIGAGEEAGGLRGRRNAHIPKKWAQCPITIGGTDRHEFGTREVNSVF